jgi:hypothetical protein
MTELECKFNLNYAEKPFENKLHTPNKCVLNELLIVADDFDHWLG